MDTSTVVAMDALQGPPPLQQPLLLSKDTPSYGATAPPLGIELSGGDTSGLTQVTNTTIDPYKWICLLEIAWPDGKSTIGTAFFQHQGGGVPIAVTCAHCLYNYDHGGWAEQINLYQARNGSTQPYTVATWGTVHSAYRISGLPTRMQQTMTTGASCSAAPVLASVGCTRTTQGSTMITQITAPATPRQPPPTVPCGRRKGRP